MFLGRRELSVVLLAIAAILFYLVLLSTKSSGAETGGGTTGATKKKNVDVDVDKRKKVRIDCLQILEIAGGDQNNNQIIRNSDATGGDGGNGGRGGDVSGERTVGNGGAGGAGGSGGGANISQDADFGDQNITVEQIQNCKNRIRAADNDDDDDDVDKDVDVDSDDDDDIDFDEDDDDVEFASKPDGDVLDTSELDELPNTGGATFFITGAVVGGLTLLGAGAGVSVWRLGSRRGRSGD